MRLPFKKQFVIVGPLLLGLVACSSTPTDKQQTTTASDSGRACAEMVASGFRKVADDPSMRFMGKVSEAAAHCRGGEKAASYLNTPWVDWANYYATSDSRSKFQGREAKTRLGEHILPDGRGIDGALMDLEYQRIELIKFNLFDQSTYQHFVLTPDRSTNVAWQAMKLPSDHPSFDDVGGNGKQLCRGDLITHRTLEGICNDLINPMMGATGMPFARNAEFEATFPRLQQNNLASNRHGGRLDLLKPDPQLISRRLFTREQSPGNGCNEGMGDGTLSPQADCDYLKAPFFNVLAAFWIQFMTHDWFSHSDEGRNKPGLVSVGCDSDQARASGCRSGDRMEGSLYAKTDQPASFEHQGRRYLERAPMTTSNLVTAWWDASQIYGYDQTSLKRVARDPQDPAKLLMQENYLPMLQHCNGYSEDCPVQPQWQGQEAAAFPDNWNIGLSFYHNLFTREHNYFVDAFRRKQQASPDADSGLRNPDHPDRVVTYKDVTDERLYQAARLVVSAEIAKIHTIEWTTQLLYDEPLYRGMNSNWFV